MLVSLAYTDCHLDRASHLRADTRIMEARLNDATSRFVPVFEDRNLVIDNGGLRASVLAASDGSPLLRQPQATPFSGSTGTMRLGSPSSSTVLPPPIPHAEPPVVSLICAGSAPACRLTIVLCSPMRAV